MRLLEAALCDLQGHLDMSVILLHVLESLQVQRQDGGQFLHPHPLMSLLGHECLLLKTGGIRWRLTWYEQQVSHLNLLSEHNVSVEEKFRKQLVTLVF